MASAQSLVDGFLLAKRAEGASPATIYNYRWRLRLFIEGLDFQGLQHIEDVTPSAIRLHLMSRRDSICESSIHAENRVIRTFFNWLENEELISSNPMKKVRVALPPRKVIKTFSPDEIRDMLELCEGNTFLALRNRAILLTFLDTGLRVGELASMKQSDLNCEAIKVWGKCSKERVVRIGATTQKAIWKYSLRHNGTYDTLWLTEEGAPLHTHGIQEMTRRIGKRAGLSGVRCSPHTFRHTFAISYLRNGGDIFTLQYLLGHSTLEMVRRYLGSLNAEDAASAHSRYSPVDNMKLR